MKHRGVDQKSTWCKESMLVAKKTQEQMIKKGYPDYKPGDWVLWIVPDIFCKYKIEEITGSIMITFRDSSMAQITHLTRRPYPNKGIYQISMRCGRKRLYGIPLVFKSFEELSNIKKVEIRWDIYNLSYISDKPLDLNLQTFNVKYDVEFRKSIQDNSYRFFTIFSKECMELYEDDKLVFDDNEFDNAVLFSGDIILDDEKTEDAIFVETTDLLHNYERDLSDNELDFRKSMINEKKDRDLIGKHIKYVKVKSEVQWNVYLLEKKEQLSAAFMADIIPQGAFGFGNI